MINSKQQQHINAPEYGATCPLTVVSSAALLPFCSAQVVFCSLPATHRSRIGRNIGCIGADRGRSAQEQFHQGQHTAQSATLTHHTVPTTSKPPLTTSAQQQCKMKSFEDVQERDAENTDARPPPLNEAIFEDPALTFSEIQQAFDRACR